MHHLLTFSYLCKHQRIPGQAAQFMRHAIDRLHVSRRPTFMPMLMPLHMLASYMYMPPQMAA